MQWSSMQEAKISLFPKAPHSSLCHSQVFTPQISRSFRQLNNSPYSRPKPLSRQISHIVRGGHPSPFSKSTQIIQATPPKLPSNSSHSHSLKSKAPTSLQLNHGSLPSFPPSFKSRDMTHSPSHLHRPARWLGTTPPSKPWYIYQIQAFPFVARHTVKS